ncbi:hypothetical protein SSS_02757 [Sarcoptes scabiei]|nr:hypothetical protein SSS_02757 [Sarcoptes scabiei]
MNLVESKTNEQAMQHHFYPYTDNGGSAIAIAGKDYAIVASDTRLSEGFTIYSRDQSKVFQLTDKTILSSTGCWCDVLTFVKVLQSRIKMSTEAIAQLVSNLLYSKRFFPYYVSNMVVGLDIDGIGVVYSYDPVGSFDRYEYSASGSSSALIQPLLDNQVALKNQQNVVKMDIPLTKALQIVKDCFVSAAERDIYCGDSAYIKIITHDGINEERFPLRRD